MYSSDRFPYVVHFVFLVVAVRLGGVMRVSTHGIVLDPKRANGMFMPATLPYPSDEEYERVMATR